MSRKVKAAAIQMRCSNNVGDNIKKADEMTREAVKKGANIILLPELFERQYFCQERRYDYYAYAKSVEENDAVQHFTQTAKELGVVIIVSFYEKNINVLYNTVTVIDADVRIEADGQAWTIAIDNGTLTQSPSVYAIRPDSPGGQLLVTVCAHITGTWK